MIIIKLLRHVQKNVTITMEFIYKWSPNVSNSYDYHALLMESGNKWAVGNNYNVTISVELISKW